VSDRKKLGNQINIYNCILGRIGKLSTH
jgi:hypothetical protein